MRLDKYLPYALLFPSLVWIIMIIAYPIVYNIWLSFHKSTYGIELGPFIGFDNYIKIFLADDVFWQDFINSVIWTIGNLFFQTIIGLGGALLLNQAIRGRELIRGLVILPWVIPTVVITLVWRWMLEPDLGIINNILHYLKLITQPVVYLGSPSLAMLTVIIINTWRFSPFAIVLILAGLQTIPRDVYESAKIDGASSIATFRYITFPMLSPILTFVGFIAFVWAFNMFDVIWLTTEGGPGNTTETLPVLVFRRAFKEYRMGQAAAITTFMFLFLLAFSFLLIKRRRG
jgi:multiple sugar transport system permease protein